MPDNERTKYELWGAGWVTAELSPSARGPLTTAAAEEAAGRFAKDEIPGYREHCIQAFLRGVLREAFDRLSGSR